MKSDEILHESFFVIKTGLHGKWLLNWRVYGLQRVLDYDSLSRNDRLGSVSFTTAELEKIATDFQVSFRSCGVGLV